MFNVVWLRAAMDTTDTILESLDPQTQDRIARAVRALNRRLEQSPLDEGESREDLYRLTFVEMLAVHFWVDPAAGVVNVVEVTRYGR